MTIKIALDLRYVFFGLVLATLDGDVVRPPNPPGASVLIQQRRVTSIGCASTLRSCSFRHGQVLWLEDVGRCCESTPPTLGCSHPKFMTRIVFVGLLTYPFVAWLILTRNIPQPCGRIAQAFPSQSQPTQLRNIMTPTPR